jgi:hypothetical protein
MNYEIVRRLFDSFLRTEQSVATLVARALFNSLDNKIVEELVTLVRQQQTREELAKKRRLDELLPRDKSRED